MSLIEYKLREKEQDKNSEDFRLLQEIEKLRQRTISDFEREEYGAAFDNTVEELKLLRQISDFSNLEVRAALVTILFDLAEIHYGLKDYKQSKKNLEHIFKYLEPLLKIDEERFGPMHLLAMELSTRVLRSRKRMLELLAKQQLHTGMLYEKVNAGVAAATDKLVESLCKDAGMLASTGDYKGAIRFYMEAIKLSKKRTGRVTRNEVAMTVEMAKLMMHSRQQTDRARRLLQAVLPHAVAAETVELEQEILKLISMIDEKSENDSAWRSFMSKVQSATRFLRRNKEEHAEDNEEQKESDNK